MKTVIFDFNGIIAEPNYRRLITELPLVEKISALRVLLNLAGNKDMRKAFNKYKKGNISIEQLQEITAKRCPHSAYVVPKLLQIYAESVKINPDVIRLIGELKKRGIQVLLMSNTIPETEQMIFDIKFDELFDGLIMSAQDQLLKPDPRIYEYAIKKFKLKPHETLMIDDKSKNLEAAAEFGIETMQCKDPKETAQFLEELVDAVDIVNRI